MHEACQKEAGALVRRLQCALQSLCCFFFFLKISLSFYLSIFFYFPLQAAIRKELNDFKSNEMEVHESSRHLTR